MPEPPRVSVSRVIPDWVIPHVRDPAPELPFWALSETTLGTVASVWLQGSVTSAYCDA